MSPRYFTLRAAPLAGLLLLAACSAPTPLPVAMTAPAAFKEAASDAGGARWQPAQAAEHRPRGDWWRAFDDPALDALIAQANVGNAGLAAAAARVAQARALAGIAQADRSVQVGLLAGAERGRNAAGAAPAAIASQYRAGLGASYELDLFGRVSGQVSAAASDAAASQADYRSVLLALQADVAQTYFRLRATDAELATLAQTVRLREEDVQINRRRHALGDIGEFDLERARTELATTRAEAIGLQRQRSAAEHALAVLLGMPAAEFSAEFSATSSALDASPRLPAIPAGMPSALLERRPDIVAAQRAMTAAHARIGVARSAMFPAVSLNGNAGGAGGAVSDIFNWSGRSWLIGAVTSLPLIDGGRNRANIARSEAVLEESVAAYRGRVLTAFAEVEDNLAGLRILDGQRQQIEQALTAARRSEELARALHAAGRSRYLDLLDAQRQLLAVERSAVQLRGERAAATVALIRALGGGWDAARVD